MELKDFRLENLPRSAQIGIFGTIAAGLCVVFYSFYLKEPLERRAGLEAEVRQLETAVAQGTAIAAQKKRFEAELEELAARLKVLQAILPSEKETPIVLRSVQEMAAGSNLTIQKFTPQPVVPRVFYSDWPIIVEVQGSYNGLGFFFERISQSTRIINVDNISVKGIEGSVNPDKTLTATCTATTFVFREDQITVPGVK